MTVVRVAVHELLFWEMLADKGVLTATRFGCGVLSRVFALAYECMRTGW